MANNDNSAWCDHTKLFTTNQKFEDREAMINWAKAVGSANRVIIVIKNSDSGSQTKLASVILQCETGGPVRRVDDYAGRRSTGSRKINCPFRLRGKAERSMGSIVWGLVVKNGLHNHAQAETFFGHEHPSRLTPEEKNVVKQLIGVGAAPRNILKALRSINMDNTTSPKVIYNFKQRHQAEILDGRTHIQQLLFELNNKPYKYAFLRDEEENRITDICWAHRRSIDLYVNFPTVLIMDTTYKANKHRMPLFEVVGVTSTHMTFSLMFAFLTRENASRFTWALQTLVGWLEERPNVVMPSVVVTDRDLAELKAIRTCFPHARNLLCIWHINQNVLRNDRLYIRNQEDFNDYLEDYNQLVWSNSQLKFFYRWEQFVARFQVYPKAVCYIWETWLHPHKEKFVGAWVNDCMHFNTKSSQRVEGAHALTKKYLVNTMTAMDASFSRLHDLVTDQFNLIDASFQKSLYIPRHKIREDELFVHLERQVSEHALELMHREIEKGRKFGANIVDAGNCLCKIKPTHGLPCKHDIALYIFMGHSIPLFVVHDHWKRLSSKPPRCDHANTTCVASIQEEHVNYFWDDTIQEPVFQTPHKGDSPMQEDHVNDFWYDAVKEPVYQTPHKGPPKTRAERSGERVKSCLEFSPSGSGRRSTREPKATPSSARRQDATIRYLDQFPPAYRGFVNRIVDVESDGNCGYRALALQLGYLHGEEDWPDVRAAMICELQTHADDYVRCYVNMATTVQDIIRRLDWMCGSCPEVRWFTIPDMGQVVANTFDRVLHTFGPTWGHCLTFLPTRNPPHGLPALAIGHVHACHWVAVFLEDDAPVPHPLNWDDNNTPMWRQWRQVYQERTTEWRVLRRGA